MPLSLKSLITMSLKARRLSTHSISPHSSFSGVTAYVLISATAILGQRIMEHRGYDRRLSTYTSVVYSIPHPFWRADWSCCWIPWAVDLCAGHPWACTECCILFHLSPGSLSFAVSGENSRPAHRPVWLSTVSEIFAEVKSRRVTFNSRRIPREGPETFQVFRFMAGW